MNRERIRIEGYGLRVSTLLRRFVEKRCASLFAKNSDLVQLTIEIFNKSAGPNDSELRIRGIASLQRKEIEAFGSGMTAYLGLASMLDKLDDALREARWEGRFRARRFADAMRAVPPVRTFSRPAFAGAS